MTLAEVLDKERDSLKAAFAEADAPETAQAAMKRALEKAFFQYMEEAESERARQTAAHLLEELKAAVSMLDVAGQPEIWEKNRGSDQALRKKEAWNPAGILLYLAGLAFLTAAAVVAMTRVPALTGGGIWELPLGLGAVAVILFFCGGIFLKKKKKETAVKPEQKVIRHMDADKLYRALQAMVVTADRQLELAAEEERADRRQAESEEKTPLPREELTLLAELMEAALSRDEGYALEKISDVKYYLHRHGIEAVDYTRDREAWFELLPGSENATLRPALVADGALLNKGIATIE